MPRSILYDNTKLAVARILGDGERQRTRAFAELQSHYLFLDRFGRPGKGNDKGKVEGLVGYARRNFLVPIPTAASFAELNARLEQHCLDRLSDRLRGHAESIGERLERDLAALQPRPPVPYDACDRRPARVSSLSLVRYERNDYSVPTAYGHRPVLVRGYVEEVVIACGAEVIARHQRSYAREDFVFDPLHYLALLEQKTGALDQAAPLQGWDLPEAFATLRRLLEARMGKPGKREYVQVLRLLETFRLEDVHAAVREALRLGAIGFDAVKHLVLVPDRAPAAQARPGGLSLPAAGHGRDHLGRGLHGPARRGARERRRRSSCWRTTSRRSSCRPSCASTTSSPGSARRRAWTTPPTCCGWPSSSCWSASGGWSSGASARPASRR